MKKNLILGILVFLIGCQPRPVSSVRVDGIMYDEKNSIAIINGETKEVGDTIGEVKIIGISEDYVQFQYKDTTFIKKMKSFSLRGLINWVKQIVSSRKSSKTTRPAKSEQTRLIHFFAARNYYNLAKETQSFEYYEKAMKEAQWALLAGKITGVKREEMARIVNDCRKFISSNEKPDEKKSIGYELENIQTEYKTYLPDTGGTSRPTKQLPNKYPGGASRPTGY